jgi:hypothetical protein
MPVSVPTAKAFRAAEILGKTHDRRALGPLQQAFKANQRNPMLDEGIPDAIASAIEEIQFG